MIVDYSGAVRYVDKMPDWYAKFRAEGKDEDEIAEIINQKKEKYVDKWGNKSRVGVLLNSYNHSHQNMQVQTPKKSNNYNGQNVNRFDLITNPNEKQKLRLSSLPNICRTSTAAPTDKGFRGKGLAFTQKARQLKKSLDQFC